ncbi:glycosyltransferase [Paraburkholderia xenovorans]|uniref:glycosyltransferase n=1 Tax=Paraburkholderia xenovorans TaxID=36873 RepID=UPI0038BA1E9D
MQKNYYGHERQQLLDQLKEKWLVEGPLACFVVGFPGVGKSALAETLMQAAESSGWITAHVKISDQVNPSFNDALCSVADQLADRGSRKMATALSDPNANPAAALERALRDQVLIVIDEAGRLFDDDGEASSELAGVLSYLRPRLNLPGRILFLSNVIVQHERWSETFHRTTLHPPTLEEAVALFADRLQGQECVDAIPPERIPDLVRVLGCNPRAIEVLAGTLAVDPLDDIIGADPGMWEVTDREVSPEFLDKLERILLERTLARLDPVLFRRLAMLAVHRTSFKDEAFGAVTSGARKDWRSLRHMLIGRFFVSAMHKRFSLNPVVREIALTHLRDDSRAFATAHSMAANYHLQRLKSGSTDETKRLSGLYAELRYHLYHAGRAQELRDVTTRVGVDMMVTWGDKSPIPEDALELDERIGVLSTLLEDEGPRPLEFYLTRCLVGRDKAGDVEQALVHIRRVCSSSRALANMWLLKAKIHERLGEPDEAIQTIRDGLAAAEATDAIAALYKTGAGLLEKQGRLDDAIVLVREGIETVSPSNSLSTLYLAALELLETQHKPDEALALLMEGITRIPADQPLFSLYHAAALLLKRLGRVAEAIALLLDGLRIVPADKGAAVIYQSAAEMIHSEGETDRAVALLVEGIRSIPVDKNLCPLYQSAAEMLAQQGKIDAALELLKEGIQTVPVDKNVDLLYRQTARILHARGESKEALELLRIGARLIPAAKTSASLHRDGADILLQSGAADAAFDMLKQGLNAAFAHSKAVYLYRSAADMLIQRGHLALAVKLVEQEVALHPGHLGLDDLLQALVAQAEQTKNEGVAMQHDAAIKQDSSDTTEAKQAAEAKQAGHTVLLMATEWRSAHGGLSTFNRHLCITLAAQGHRVYCAVPQAGDSDIAHARQHGVTLVAAPATLGADELSGLSRRLPLPSDVLPSHIVGHGRITGAFAKDQQCDFFPQAKRIHFVHMAPGEIEWFKEPEKAAEKVDAREKIEVALASDAQLVVAVGPSLMREYADLLRGTRGSPRVVEFVPGPIGVVEAVTPPHLNHCLVLGRADDSELKGLDIAARALSYVVRDRAYTGALPELVIRGASPGTGATLRKKLLDICEGVDVPVKVKEYSADEGAIESDIRRAALLLMPSRREGFGLVALEGLAQGTPVLATDKSGFADIVERLAPERLLRNAVVETPSDRDKAAKNWADAISRQLTDRHAAFSRAAELGNVLAKGANWEIATRQLMAEVELRGT